MFTFQSQIVTGYGIGKQLGYPTLNFVVPTEFTLGPGVYACRLKPSASSPQLVALNGVLFYGPRRTFREVESSLEVHLFDMPTGLEVSSATVEVLDQIREPRVFSSREELQAAIQQDCAKARRVLGDTPKKCT